MKFTPLGDLVVVELVKLGTQVGLIHLPQGVHERSRSRKAVVVSVGPKARLCGVGDTVYVAISAGATIPDSERELVLIGDNEVLARE